MREKLAKKPCIPEGNRIVNLAKRSPLVKGKRPKRRKMKEGSLFSLDGVKKVKGNLGTKEPFPVFPFPCLSVFSQVYSCPDDETEDPFEEAGDNGKIKIIHKLS
jgi:hypothetical protein